MPHPPKTPFWWMAKAKGRFFHQKGRFGGWQRQRGGEGWTFQQKTAACKAPAPKRSGAQKQSAIKYRYQFTASRTAEGPAA